MSASGGLKIAVFASGRGSNVRALADAIQAGIISNSTLSLVVSNNSICGALEFARQRNIPALHISRSQFRTDGEFTASLLITLGNFGVNFIALAGYMKKLPVELVKAFKNRIVNIHPALLPEFGGKGMYGMNVHNAVIERGVKVSGATVHLVDEEYDTGPIVLQERVEVLPSDTPESLAEKVLHVEHRLYPKAISLFAMGKVHVRGKEIIIYE
ncbi:MAG: phosphoribosylglycinamide formyltransferase [Bacteroidetes bacterium]|nr:MAG: phosphoribosylglycinamide formyltransferase [Bacteroidota bacterium]